MCDISAVLTTPAEYRKQGVDEQIVERRDESQRVVGQAYSTAYNTLSQSSRLQAICRDNNSKLRSRAKAQAFYDQGA